MSEPLRDFVRPWLEESERKGWQNGWDEGHGIGWNEGHGIGWDEGQKIGQKNYQNEVARSMLRDSLPLKTIMKYSGLGETDIFKIAGSIGVPIIAN